MFHFVTSHALTYTKTLAKMIVIRGSVGPPKISSKSGRFLWKFPKLVRGSFSPFKFGSKSVSKWTTDRPTGSFTSWSCTDTNFLEFSIKRRLKSLISHRILLYSFNLVKNVQAMDIRVARSYSIHDCISAGRQAKISNIAENKFSNWRCKFQNGKFPKKKLVKKAKICQKILLF